MTELIKAVEVRLAKQAELQRRAEERLQQLRASLSLALPHELVTPLNSILGFSSLLLDAALPPNEIQECARHIHDSASRLQRLIENFIFYAHLEVVAGDPVKAAEFRKIDSIPVHDFIHQVATRIAASRNRNADLQLRLTSCDLAIVPANLRHLAQELIDNAFKFSLPGNAVHLESRCEDGHFELRVKDHGRGMSTEQIRNIGAHVQFDRKHQEQQGSGLGLAIANRLAQLHNGTLRIDSKPGEGTLVTVRLPLAA